MSKTTIYVNGPMHPDLFGGETPIRIKKKLELHAFMVEVTWNTPEQTTVIVAGKDEEDAIEKAMARIEEREGVFDIVDDSIDGEVRKHYTDPMEIIYVESRGQMTVRQFLEEEAKTLECTSTPN
jgi:hypothetical protein